MSKKRCESSRCGYLTPASAPLLPSRCYDIIEVARSREEVRVEIHHDSLLVYEMVPNKVALSCPNTVTL